MRKIPPSLRSFGSTETGLTRQQLGRLWEHRAGRYLEDQGLEILKRGYRCRLGELDLVCRDGITVVVVEVRARSSSHFASAAESIDWKKRRRIVQATRHLLMTHPQWSECGLRFDIFSANRIESTAPSIRWIKNAFDASDA